MSAGLNALQRELVKYGFAKEPKEKRSSGKVIRCKYCGHEMIIPENTNVAVCSNDKCKSDDNFIVFDRSKRDDKRKLEDRGRLEDKRNDKRNDKNYVDKRYINHDNRHNDNKRKRVDR